MCVLIPISIALSNDIKCIPDRHLCKNPSLRKAQRGVCIGLCLGLNAYSNFTQSISLRLESLETTTRFWTPLGSLLALALTVANAVPAGIFTSLNRGPSAVLSLICTVPPFSERAFTCTLFIFLLPKSTALY
jgi:hypothetical protein